MPQTDLEAGGIAQALDILNRFQRATPQFREILRELQSHKPGLEIAQPRVFGEALLTIIKGLEIVDKVINPD